jgi:hypothetical protein
MAGAGYKLFATGDVLTAAEVNTYLMQQAVMVFDDAAARTTALSGVVAEGMLSYLKDTNAVEVYDGANWVASDDPNAIQNTIVDAKGDLISATGSDVPARLAVGNDGETLVADSAATTGLRWQGDYAAGKNKIINGDFAINQRGFTSTTTNDSFIFDRYYTRNVDGTVTFSAETFTLGTAPVSGYESKSYARIVTTGQTLSTARASLNQRMESVRTFAGQTITVSFWAKSASGTPSICAEMVQNFGTGGSPSSAVTAILSSPANKAISTTWARYSFTINVPSISGKTLGSNNNDYFELLIWVSAGSDFNARTGTLGIQSNTFDIWGVQVEAGSVATAFQTATGTLQGELAACQRYYFRTSNDSSFSRFAMGSCESTTAGVVQFVLPVQMRVAPTAVEFSNLRTTDLANDYGAPSSVTINTFLNTRNLAVFNVADTGWTAYRPLYLEANNNAAAHLAVTAEL